jgi:hypothetical protein
VGARVEAAEGGGGAEPVPEVLVAHGEQLGGPGGLADLVPGRDGPADEADQGVAAAPVAGAQVAFPVDRPRRRQRPERRLQHGLALDVQGQAVLEGAGPGVGRLGQADEGLAHALLVLQHAVAAVPGDQGVAEHAAPGRAVLLGHRDQPLEDVWFGTVGEQGAEPVGLGEDRGRGPHRQPPGLDRFTDRGVDPLAERGRHRHHLSRTTGDRRRGVVAHPLRGG